MGYLNSSRARRFLRTSLPQKTNIDHFLKSHRISMWRMGNFRSNTGAHQSEYNRPYDCVMIASLVTSAAKTRLPGVRARRVESFSILRGESDGYDLIITNHMGDCILVRRDHFAQSWGHLQNSCEKCSCEFSRQLRNLEIGILGISGIIGRVKQPLKF